VALAVVVAHQGLLGVLVVLVSQAKEILEVFLQIQPLTTVVVVVVVLVL